MNGTLFAVSPQTTRRYRRCPARPIFGKKITNFYAVRNPDKLVTVAVPRRISR